MSSGTFFSFFADTEQSAGDTFKAPNSHAQTGGPRAVD